MVKSSKMSKFKKVVVPVSPLKKTELKQRGMYGKSKVIEAIVPYKAQIYQPSRDDATLGGFDLVEAKCNLCGYRVAEFKHSKTIDDLRYRNFDIVYFYQAYNDQWHGCKGVNISKKTKISFECCCGNDNRDKNKDGQLSQNVGFKLLIK